MTTFPSSLPKVESDDPELVVIALETATTLWDNGDHREALRWLRKAAEAAGDAGADVRSVALAKSAADLATAIDVPPSAPPSASVRSSGRTGAASLPWEAAEAPPAPRHAPTPRPPARSSAGKVRQTLRVAVFPETTPGQLTVRPLTEEEPVPAGSQEALLVGLHPGVELKA